MYTRILLTYEKEENPAFYNTGEAGVCETEKDKHYMLSLMCGI